jgi:DNA-binding response OmpR family regulator
MKALVVDDDLVLADVVSFTLRRAGFEVLLAHDGVTALERFRAEAPGLVILDVELPRLDGLEVCRTIHAESNVPIIMLTVRDSDEDIVRGLDLGADDYITKPFSPAQLVARAQAVLRRAGESALPRRLSFEELSLNAERHALEIADRETIPLTQLEYKLLEALIQNHEQVLPVDTLIARIWGPSGGDKAMLKQLVYRLRKKISPEDAPSGVYIEAIPGIGYALMRRSTSRR